jgi:hypothetical protein
MARDGRVALAEDGAIVIEVAAPLPPAVARWLPTSAQAAVDARAPRAVVPVVRVVRVVRVAASVPPVESVERPAHSPLLVLGGVTARADSAEPAARVSLATASPACAGTVDLGARCAELRVPSAPSGDDPDAPDVYSMLTVATALLLGRLGRTLVHAAAVVRPGGGAWLLVGDTHAGKSSTTMALVAEGWDYLADDHVVLRADGARVTAEGWPRAVHLDEGWDAGVPTGRRRAVDLTMLAPGRWRRSAPLEGVLFPRVEAARPTAVEPLAAADALTRLVRQAPWLLADRGAARDVLALLARAAAAPAYALTLGLDCYARGARLAALVGRLGPAPGRHPPGSR